MLRGGGEAPRALAVSSLCEPSSPLLWLLRSSSVGFLVCRCLLPQLLTQHCLCGVTAVLCRECLLPSPLPLTFASPSPFSLSFSLFPSRLLSYCLLSHSLKLHFPTPLCASFGRTQRRRRKETKGERALQSRACVCLCVCGCGCTRLSCFSPLAAHTCDACGITDLPPPTHPRRKATAPWTCFERLPLALVTSFSHLSSC